MQVVPFEIRRGYPDQTCCEILDEIWDNIGYWGKDCGKSWPKDNDVKEKC